jgi:uncharacterized MAPEG superfamily protein
MTIALWCGLIAMPLPYVCFGIARNRGEARTVDACATTTILAIFRIGSGAWRSARGTRSSIRSNCSPASRRPSIAHPVHAPQHPVDALAVVWVVARMAYVAFYLGDKAALRSAAQFLSLACVLGFFVAAGLA